MDFKPLSQDISVSEQIDPAEIQAIVDAGFKTIVSNRPDGEQDGQPTFAEITNASDAAGLDVFHVPVVPGALEQSHVDAFARILDEAPKPILAFCRTGTRSTTLWAMIAAHRGEAISSIVETAADAGYNISGLAEQLSQIQKSSAK